jgi:hypothetical protein
LREPPELDFAAERPTVINSILKVHFEGLGYSIEEVAQMLRLHEWDLRAMYRIEIKEPPRPRIAILK